MAYIAWATGVGETSRTKAGELREWAGDRWQTSGDDGGKSGGVLLGVSHIQSMVERWSSW